MIHTHTRFRGERSLRRATIQLMRICLGRDLGCIRATSNATLSLYSHSHFGFFIPGAVSGVTVGFAVVFSRIFPFCKLYAVCMRPCTIRTP
jgi:hypothetical protein